MRVAITAGLANFRTVFFSAFCLVVYSFHFSFFRTEAGAVVDIFEFSVFGTRFSRVNGCNYNLYRLMDLVFVEALLSLYTIIR